MTMQMTSRPDAIDRAAAEPASRLSAADRARLERLNRVWNDDIARSRAEVLEIYTPLSFLAGESPPQGCG